MTIRKNRPRNDTLPPYGNAEDQCRELGLTPRERLKRLRADADAACEAARGDSACRRDAVNWADFGCSIAEGYITDEGDSGTRVILEEAAPDCGNVQGFVHRYLRDRGWSEIEVVTEW